MAKKKLTDDTVRECFKAIALGSSVRAQSRKYGVTHWALILRLIRLYGQEKYRSAINKHGTVPLLKDAILSIPERRRAEVEQWLDQNINLLLEIDSVDPPVRLYGSNHSEIWKISINESILPDKLALPY